ncbi:MAG: hypothetical protein LWX52_11665, partial [Deltaproteobacteria bacterium]|nr:hypothetical protein [Deltaproteobacteria bacterium]
WRLFLDPPFLKKNLPSRPKHESICSFKNPQPLCEGLLKEQKMGSLTTTQLAGLHPWWCEQVVHRKR